ncbi:LysR family transcriptional regulator [Asaia krungthepensis]|uniref:Transcriptional regulator n=1 Tax=Asaia krungthepensis NRIC 0535 TaxID=1307925 RepID=A0ABQ0Q473_9PROT|nr:LysR family transcriptional regulator [Asaia krungthepensis]GBQ90585.1 transcriptional regulator [Asaia krungthepensis NRIC 0535]
MDFNLAQSFLALWHERSVSKAALRLSLTQPAVSAALRRLRALSDDPLFIRTPQGMQPTIRAVAMAPIIEESLRRLREALGQADPFDPSLSRRHFVIGCDSGLDYRLAPALTQKLRQMAPGLSLSFRAIPPDGLETAFHKREIDLGVTAHQGTHPDCIASSVGPLVMECVGSDLAGLSDKTMSIAELCSFDHVLIEHARRFSRFDHALRGLGHERRVSVTVPSFGHIPPFLYQPGIVAIVPHYIAQVFCGLSALQRAPLPEIMETMTIRLLVPSLSAADTAVVWMRGIIQRELETWWPV